MKYHIYSIGNALVDQMYEVDNSFLTDHGISKSQRNLITEAELKERLDALHQNGTRAALVGGGSAANSMATASYLGAEVYFSCTVADDESGDFFLQDMQAAGIDSKAKEINSSITGTCVVMVTPDAERTMNTCLGVSNQLTYDVINETALAQSDFVFLEGYMVTNSDCMATAKCMFTQAQENQQKRVVAFSDPALVEHFNLQLHELLIQGVELLFCNEEEALIFTNTDALDQAFEALKNTAQQFVITLGEKGALGWDGSKDVKIDAFPVKAIDTVGAGDAFAGAFTYALATGNSFADSGKLASKTAAEVVSRFGARLTPEEYQQIKASCLLS